MPWKRCLVLLGLAMFLGCSSTSGPPLTPVTGRITVDDKPLPGARVLFIPQGDTKGHGGQATTSADGKYEIVAQRMDNRKDLLPGTYKVVVTRVLQPDGTPLPPNAIPIESNVRETVPDQYTRAMDTPLTATIGAEALVLDFPLQSAKE